MGSEVAHWNLSHQISFCCDILNRVDSGAGMMSGKRSLLTRQIFLTSFRLASTFASKDVTRANVAALLYAPIGATNKENVWETTVLEP